jgi:hypothetical protein
MAPRLQGQSDAYEWSGGGVFLAAQVKISKIEFALSCESLQLTVTRCVRRSARIRENKGSWAMTTQRTQSSVEPCDHSRRCGAARARQFKGHFDASLRELIPENSHKARMNSGMMENRQSAR